MLSITFVGKFGKRPMHFFGVYGSIMFLVGFFAAVYIGLNKLYRLNNDLETILVTNNPYFYIALTAMIMGTMLFMGGFMSELIARNSPNRNHYLVEKRISQLHHAKSES